MKVKMKKTIVLLVVAFIILGNAQSAFSHQRVTTELSPLIKMYKMGNYTECYKKLTVLSKKDPSNALIYYYLGMSATQLGKKDEAIVNYMKASNLAEQQSNLYRYSERGKACVQDLPACTEVTETGLSDEDLFIMAPFESFSEKARGEYEKLKLENMMREINRTKDVAPSQFNEFKDFSGMNDDGSVSDAAIIAAYRTLQKAGLSDFYGSDISLLLNANKKGFDNNITDITDVNPEYIQMLLMNNF